MIDGLDGPGVRCPSTRRTTRRSVPFREAKTNRSADPRCLELQRILLWYRRDGGDTNRGANTSPTMLCPAPTRRRWSPPPHGNEAGAVRVPEPRVSGVGDGVEPVEVAASTPGS